jgi:hypothetical protein
MNNDINMNSCHHSPGIVSDKFSLRREYLIAVLVSVVCAFFATLAIVKMRGLVYINGAEHDFHMNIVHNTQIAPYQYRPLMSFVVVAVSHFTGQWLRTALTLKFLVHTASFFSFYLLARRFLSPVWGCVAICVFSSALPLAFYDSGLDYYQYTDATLLCIALLLMYCGNIFAAAAIIVAGMLNKETIGTCIPLFLLLPRERTKKHYAAFAVTGILAAGMYVGIRVLFGTSRAYCVFNATRTLWQMAAYNLTNGEMYANLMAFSGLGTLVLVPFISWRHQPRFLRVSLVYITAIYIPITIVLTRMREPRQFLWILLILIIMTLFALSHYSFTGKTDGHPTGTNNNP